MRSTDQLAGPCHSHAIDAPSPPGIRPHFGSCLPIAPRFPSPPSLKSTFQREPTSGCNCPRLSPWPTAWFPSTLTRISPSPQGRPSTKTSSRFPSAALPPPGSLPISSTSFSLANTNRWKMRSGPQVGPEAMPFPRALGFSHSCRLCLLKKLFASAHFRAIARRPAL